ncbi:MAG: helix-turn-helix domain-containing protein [Chthoniobacterales bacterium]
MEGIGEKFQKARMARNLTLEEAARMTKIRPNKLAEIEAEDFSRFPSLAYAKGFLLIYGKFLNVDVSPYLEAFETSEHMTVDGYSYLQDNPAPKPRRVEVVPRRSAGNKSSLMPLVIGIVVLIAGFSLLRLIMDVRRIKPSSERDAQALAQFTPTPAPSVSTIIAPHALPVDSTPAPKSVAIAPTIAPTPEPTAVALATPEVSEPEVRRAEPVHASDLAKAQLAMAASPSPSAPPAGNRFDIRPLRKTFVKITVDGESGRSSFSRWMDVSGAPVQLRGKKIAVKVLDPSDLEIRKNGKVIARGDSDVRLE